MTCAGCESSIKEAVGAIPGVTTVNASHTEGSAQVEYDAAQVNPEAIRTAIEKLGYGIAPEPAPAAEQAAPTQS
ncbi:MAG: heavy-metal-associated domain-containing protein [Acidobacteria bacterium]|nr:heavy-metal-associated domain-containing protein [Acidobacteriota bacterium]